MDLSCFLGLRLRVEGELVVVEAVAASETDESKLTTDAESDSGMME